MGPRGRGYAYTSNLNVPETLLRHRGQQAQSGVQPYYKLE